MAFWKTSRKFTQQPHTRAKGRVGEDEAERWLRAEGYKIVARNVINRAGELDVVAMDGDTLCFVEIKARANQSYGKAIEAITPHKQKKLARVAAFYLVSHPPDGPCRFDVLAMDLIDERWNFTLVRDAFPVPSAAPRY